MSLTGYTTAARIDRLVSKFMEATPLTKKNLSEYLALTRTISTTVIALESAIQEKIKAN